MRMGVALRSGRLHPNLVDDLLETGVLQLIDALFHRCLLCIITLRQPDVRQW